MAQVWLDAFAPVYKELANTGVRIVIGTYFASVAEHLNLLKSLPVHGVHIDCVRAPSSWPCLPKAGRRSAFCPSA